MILSFIVAVALIAGTIALVVRGVKTAVASERHSTIAGFVLILTIGLIAGVWLGVFGEFKINERIRIQGAPVPLVIFVLEDQNWTDFVKPPTVSYLCMVANALFPVGVFALLWTLFESRLGKHKSTTQI